MPVLFPVDPSGGPSNLSPGGLSPVDHSSYFLGTPPTSPINSRPRNPSSPLSPQNNRQSYATSPTVAPSPVRRDSQVYTFRARKRYRAANPYTVAMPSLSLAASSITPDPSSEAEKGQHRPPGNSNPEVKVNDYDYDPEHSPPDAIGDEPMFGVSSVSVDLRVPGRTSTLYPELGTDKPVEEPPPEFSWKTIPVQVYVHALLRLPDLYWNRLDQIFRDLDEAAGRGLTTTRDGSTGGARGRDSVYGAMDAGAPFTPAYEDGTEGAKDFTHTLEFEKVWEQFVSSLIKEWETLNVVSALLLTAIFTIFQIDAASRDSNTRTFAVLSFACSLMSLLYGCTYIIRFGSVKRVVEARTWVERMQRENRHLGRYFWNEWILLAMPAVWISWSILLFIVCILCFVWRIPKGPPLEGEEVLVFELGPKIAVTVLLGLGVLYFFFIAWTFRIGWEKDNESDRDRSGQKKMA